MKSRLTRRNFIRGAAAGGAGWVILKDSRSVYGAPANSKLNTAHIGCAGRAGCFVGAKGDCCAVVNDGHRVAVMCDVNEQRAAPAFQRWPDAIKGNDYRVMFDKFSDKFDAVVVATGDYGHAPASAAAIRAGKPVFCEKPLTVAVREARLLGDLAAKHKVLTQMGNQHGYDRRAVNLAWSGMIGEVREAHAWCASQGGGRKTLPSGYHPIPRTLKWDLWLGPAPYRDFHPAWMSYNAWREFGTAMLGNRASHSMATLFKCLKIGELRHSNANPHPIIKVTGQCSELTLYSFPKWDKVTWEVPAREGMPPVKVHWYGGDLDTERKKFEDLLGRKLQLGGAGEAYQDWLNSIIVGDKGTLYCGGYAGLVDALPKDKFEGVEPPDMLPKNIGASGLRGWYNAILEGKTEPMSSFDGFSGPYTEFQNMAHVSTLFPGETLEFDPVDCRVVNNSLADFALRRQYRPGWGMEEAS